MKPMKSIVMLTVGALAFSSCSKKTDDAQTTATGNQDTTMGAGTAGTDMNATGVDSATTNAEGTDATTTNATQTTTTEQGSGAVPGPADSSANLNQNDRAAANATQAGTGAVSDEAELDELNSDQNLEDDSYSDSQIEEDEALPRGTGSSSRGENYEYVDETSSEPDDVRGGRDSRMVPREGEIDNTSSEPDRDQM